MMARTLYGLRPAVVFEAAVRIMRNQIPAAKEIASGKLEEFPGVRDLLGPSSADPDTSVTSWIDGKNTYIPDNIDHFFERAFLQMNLTCPESLTLLRFLEQAGIRNHNGYFQASPSEEHETLLNLSNEYLTSALQDPARWGEISPDQVISHKILKYTVENCNRTFRDQIYPVEQLGGPHAMFVILMSDFAHVENMEDVELYLRRLEQSKIKFGHFTKELARKRELGVMPPKVCLEKISRSIEGIVSNLKTVDNPFMKSVEAKYAAATKTPLPEEVRSRITSKIDEYVIPAYQELKREIETCITQTRTEAGVWALPDGDNFYKHCLKWQTTTDLTAEEVHHLGLKHVATLLEGIQGIVEKLNEKGDMTLNASHTAEENLKILGEDSKFLYEDTVEQKEECIAEYKRLLGQISEKVAGMFNILPSSQCMVKPMPKAMGEGGAGACYFTGSLDLQRPGVFFANLTNIKSQNKSQMKTLTAHEAVPGHHFQLSLTVENMEMHYFRRGSAFSEDMFTAYVEGWGLYAEHIGNEVGFYREEDGSEGYSVLGYYTAELLRSSRLVVDTGLHAFKWSRSQAVEYMKKNTGMTTQEAEDEVDRYCVLPAQACAYKIGQLKLLEIRHKLEARQGDAFDLRKFHDTILHIGSVPLDILENMLLEM